MRHDEDVTLLVVILGWTLVSVPLAAAVGRMLAGPAEPDCVAVWLPAEPSQVRSDAVVQ